MLKRKRINFESAQEVCRRSEKRNRPCPPVVLWKGSHSAPGWKRNAKVSVLDPYYDNHIARRLRGWSLGSQRMQVTISGSELRAHGERCRSSVQAMALAAALVQVIV
jgi:hypothetical protein